MTTYWEMLRDPRWQRKRLEIMARDSFACLQCSDKERTLNVHHTYYRKGLKPWEYPDESLRTLCEKCHGVVTQVTSDIQQLMGQLELHELRNLLGFVKGSVAFSDKSYFAGVDSIAAADDEEWAGVCQAARLSPSDGSWHRVIDRAHAGDGSVPVEWLVDLYLAQLDRLKEPTSGG